MLSTNPKLAFIRRRRATRPKRRPVPIQAFPTNIEREYARAMFAIMDDVHARVMREVVTEFPSSVRTDAARHEVTVAVKLDVVMVDTMRVINRKRAGLLAQGIGAKVQRFTTAAIGAQVKAVIGVNPLASAPALAPHLIDNFVQANVSLIRSVPQRYFDQVAEIVTESATIGRRSSEVAALVQERFDVSKSNALRIARDQIGKFNGAVTEARQTDLGVTGYVWRTSLDERVRASHAAHEGVRFDWNAPPFGTGHPGDDIQCRCRAEPDLSAFFG